MRLRRGFTLIEVMVATAVLAVLLVLTLSVTNEVSRGVGSAMQKVDSFESARAGFEMMSQGLGNAVLNTYWDYYDANRLPRTQANAASFSPDRYGRQSDLNFQIRDLANGSSLPVGWSTVSHGVFFQSPRGTENSTPSDVLGAEGYFVAFGQDPAFPNLAALNNPKRFRLFRWSQPSSELDVNPATGKINATPTAAPWITPTTNVHPVADNIIALIARVPSTSAKSADSFFWNSQQVWSTGDQPNQMHQMPPLVELTMVAIDAKASSRLIEQVANAEAAYAALGLPNPATLFNDPSKYEDDLQKIETGLANKGVDYQILALSVPVNGSRWNPN